MQEIVFAAAFTLLNEAPEGRYSERLDVNVESIGPKPREVTKEFLVPRKLGDKAIRSQYSLLDHGEGASCAQESRGSVGPRATTGVLGFDSQ
jgi:hypothetical protein